MATLLPVAVGGVEVKVSFREPARVRDAFGLTGKPDRRRTLFFLDVPEENGGLRLLARAVVLRLRQSPGGDGDTTVKLRPADPAVLTGRWDPAHHGDDEYKVEGDWARTLVLAASQDAEVDEERLTAVIGGDAGAERAFSATQRAFLAHCLPGLDDPFHGLRVAGPIRSDRWDVGDVDPFVGPTALRAERWRYAGSTEFMELSALVPASEAAASRDRLLAECSARGLVPESGAGTKTETVLRDLLPVG